MDAKRKKLNIDENQLVGNNQSENDGSSFSADTAVFAGTSSDSESKPEMCKLNDDCFAHLFEWLSLKELLVLRRTSKDIKAAVDFYINLKYPRLRHLYMNNYENALKSYQMQLDYFGWIRHLRIRNIILTSARIDNIKSVLNQLESLELIDVKMDDDSCKMLLTYCCRLKHLSLITTTSTRLIIGAGNKWLHGQYPALEHVRIETGARYKHPLLLEFLQRNPNIRIFSTDCKFLSTNRHLMVKSNYKFEHLNLKVGREFDFIHHLANNLHEQNFYGKLHLCVNDERWWSQDRSDNLWKLRNIETLSMFSLPRRAVIPVVESMNKLCIETCTDAPPDILKLMATNFINLNRVTMLKASLYDVRSFVCFAPKLEQIRVRTLHNIKCKKLSLRDLLALNKERKKLVGARKITIYIDEKIFLEMKWSAKLNLSMIELKRIDWIEKDDLFDCHELGYF